MSSWFLSNEPQLRLGIFLSMLALLIVWQRLSPRRSVSGGLRRSATNVALVVIDTLILRLAFPLLAFDLALQLEASGGGLAPQVSGATGIILGLILLDFSIYWQHRVLHWVPFLWRLHRVHHADTSFDVTTALRFHPFEIVLSMMIKLGLIWLLSVPAMAVLVFEVLLSSGALFTHSNVMLPQSLDRWLRWLIVTPDMHRVHHSVYPDETNSNYGFHLSIWDRLFGSYRPYPLDGHTRMQIGLRHFRETHEQSLGALLVNPFRSNDRGPD